MNGSFAEFNNEKRKAWIASQVCIIVLSNDILYLFTHGKLCSKLILNLEEYHLLKEVAHAHVMRGESFNMEYYLRRTARLYLNELHTSMQFLKPIFNEGELPSWKGVFIACCGGPSAKEGNAAMQYFKRLKATTYYIENVYNVNEALELMAQLEVERVFFDPIRNMRTDVLAEETEIFLKEVCDAGAEKTTLL